MMRSRKFSAKVDKWVARSKKRAVAVFREATERLVEEMQKPRGAGGRMRVDTGFLRASLMASTSHMPTIRQNARPADGMTYAYDSGPISLVIQGTELGEVIYLGYTASYAAYREYGARGQAPDAFVRTAATKWQRIVRKTIADAKARVK